MIKTLILSLLIVGVGYQNYQIEKRQNVIYDILTEIEADRLRANEKKILNPSDFNNALSTALKHLNEYEKSKSRVHYHALILYVGRAFDVYHRDRIKKIVPHYTANEKEFYAGVNLLKIKIEEKIENEK